MPFPSLRPYLQKYIIDVPKSSNSNENIFVYVKKELDALHDLAIPVYISMAKKDKPHLLHLPANKYVGVIVNNDGNEAAKFEVIEKKE